MLALGEASPQLEQDAAPAVVMSCIGGHQGDLSVVRTLGRAGIPVIVLSEYMHNPLRFSRYTAQFIHGPWLTRDRVRLANALLKIAESSPCPPVVFPTADPDLHLLNEIRSELEPHCVPVLADRVLTSACMDKGRFHELARQRNLPVPHTTLPKDAAGVRELASYATFPLIVKPLVPQEWSQPRIAKLVEGKKAVRVDSGSDLSALARQLGDSFFRTAIQEFIPGRDDRLFSVHAYVDREGTSLGMFTGQKIRTFPTYAGIGCFVRSPWVPELADLALSILSTLDYRGAALLQFKQHAETGEFVLLEINPRVSSWNLLATRSGVNIPLLAYEDLANDRREPAGRQRVDLQYVYLWNDFLAFLDYRRHGDWTTAAWLRSLIGRNVNQMMSLDDPMPMIRGHWFAAGTSILRRAARRLKRIAASP